MPHLAEPAVEDSPGHTTVAWLHPAGKTPCEFQGWSQGPNPGRAQEGSWPGSSLLPLQGEVRVSQACQVSLREDTLVWDCQELGSGCARGQRKREAVDVLGWGRVCRKGGWIEESCTSPGLPAHCGHLGLGTYPDSRCREGSQGGPGEGVRVHF